MILERKIIGRVAAEACGGLGLCGCCNALILHRRCGLAVLGLDVLGLRSRLGVALLTGLPAILRLALGALFFLTAAEELDVICYNLGGVLLHAGLVCVLAGAKAPFDVDLHSFPDEFFC